MLTHILHLLLAGQAAATPTPALGAQQLFDRASQSAADGKCAEALKDFAALERRTNSKPNRLLGAAIDVRKGGCLIRSERVEEGEAALRRGLPVLAAQPKEFAADLRDGHILLGQARVRQLDYAGAAEEYRHALDGATGTFRIRPLMGLASVLASIMTARPFDTQAKRGPSRLPIPPCRNSPRQRSRRCTPACS
ncbi:hypothetical protein [Sphingomonas sp. 3-13AW]|jgi:hypothetical protein|uniref:hypothetical protein n=1 Tax=Sphingomonas sp. 3-13AW TaxID=3050450 RepID=UPI003BB4D185